MVAYTLCDQAHACLATDQNGLVYCVPRKVIYQFAITNSTENPGNRRCDHDKADLRDLLTEEPLVMPRESLLAYAVPDTHLVSFLVCFGVRGIHTPYKTKPYTSDPSEIPLHGNVTNPKWASISLGGSCNSRCIFCYTDWIRSVPDLRVSQIKDLIKRIAELGTKALVLSGGEATIRPELASLVEYAKRNGFSRIELQTNGRALREHELLRRLVEAGLTGVLLSLHGPDEKIHDRITGSQGSFSQAMSGLRNLRDYPVGLTINTVICQLNYMNLAQIVTLAARLLKDQGSIRFSYTIVEGAAFDNIDKVLVAFSKLRPSLLQAIQLTKELGLNAEVANMPLCTFGNCDTTYDRVQQREFVDASPFYKFNVARGEKSVKFNKCSQCSKFTLCPGIQVEYLRAFPNSSEEFIPVS
jgi:pyruvate-formate lyase-activating enzyme